MTMHKTSVEIDLDAIREAERNLGTRGFKETINRALEEVNRRAWHQRAARYVLEERESASDWDEFIRTRRGKHWGSWENG